MCVRTSWYAHGRAGCERASSWPSQEVSSYWLVQPVSPAVPYNVASTIFADLSQGNLTLMYILWNRGSVNHPVSLTSIRTSCATTLWLTYTSRLLAVLELLDAINADQPHSPNGAFEQRYPQAIPDDVEKTTRVARGVSSLSVPLRHSLQSSTLRKLRAQRVSGWFALASSVPMLQRPSPKK